MMLAVQIALLLMLSCFVASDPLDGIYPDVTNCYKGVQRGDESAILKHNQILQNTCKSGGLDENALCYKRCMLERTGMLYLKNEDNGGMFYTVKPYSVAKEVTNLLRFPIGVDENQIQSGWMGLEKLVGSCQELGVLVPKEVERLKCQDIPPEYQERMWGFVNCVENALKC